MAYQQEKTELLFEALRCGEVNSFVDLGGCFQVNGIYSFLLCNMKKGRKGFVIDAMVTEETRLLAKHSGGNLVAIEGVFGNESLRQTISHVDMVIMFDVLLHQADPPWHVILSEWGTKANMVVIFNPMFKAATKSFRFISRGKDWYKKHIPYMEEEEIDNMFDSPDVIDESWGVPFKDTPGFWQWGITTEDIIHRMGLIGFQMVYMKSYGQYEKGLRTFPWMRKEGYIFTRNTGEKT